MSSEDVILNEKRRDRMAKKLHEWLTFVGSVAAGALIGGCLWDILRRAMMLQ